MNLCPSCGHEIWIQVYTKRTCGNCFYEDQKLDFVHRRASVIRLLIRLHVVKERVMDVDGTWIERFWDNTSS